MTATPGATAVTKPALETVATLASVVAQVTRRSSTAPPASRALALSCTVAPTSRAFSAGTPETVTLATGTAGAVGPLSQLMRANTNATGTTRCISTTHLRLLGQREESRWPRKGGSGHNPACLGNDQDFVDSPAVHIHHLKAHVLPHEVLARARHVPEPRHHEPTQRAVRPPLALGQRL